MQAGARRPPTCAARFASPSNISKSSSLRQRPRPFAVTVRPGDPNRAARRAARARRLLRARRPLSAALDAAHDGRSRARRRRVATSPSCVRDLRRPCSAPRVEAGVTRLLPIGGAQAIAALAYGTESIARVDKIVGPGNAWVAAAKDLVARDCAIDFHAGPSEIVVWSDTGDPAWIAADLVAQAEHDPAARAIFVTTRRGLAERVAEAVRAQSPADGPARTAIRRQGAIIVARDRERGERRREPPRARAPRVRSAGRREASSRGGHHLRRPLERAGGRRLLHGIESCAADRRRGAVSWRAQPGRFRPDLHRPDALGARPAIDRPGRRSRSRRLRGCRGMPSRYRLRLS